MTRTYIGDNPDLVGLCDWEDNGYHDSDFYMAVLNRKTGEVIKQEIGTTRFAAPPEYTGYRQDLTADDVRMALTWLEERIYRLIKQAEYDEVLMPDSIEEGTAVILLQDHRSQVREINVEPCHKCAGTGGWVNPRDPEDVRDCFGCNGTGERRVVGEKVCGDDGKLARIVYPAGMVGTVCWVGTFRQIYARGYNKLDRSTISTKVELADGTAVAIPLAKLRLDKEPLSDDELRRRAHALAYHCKFGAVFGRGYAWDSKNRTQRWLKDHPDFKWFDEDEASD